MTRQAENCVNLFRGQQPEKIEAALRMLQKSVLQELLDHYNKKSIEDLAYQLFLDA